MNNWKLGVIAGFFGLLALGASIAVPFLILNTAENRIAELRVPLLALSGFIGVFACIALLVLAYNAMGLANRDQSLGMPEGSVRALIAILLIVTLGITGIFLLSPKQAATLPEQPPPKENNEVKPQSPPQGTEAAPAATTLAVAPSFRFAAVVSPPKGTDSNSSKGGGSGPGEKPATTKDTNQDGDLSKQFLTLVGGLVTTVIGFYFGSQTANSAAAKGANAAKEAATQAATEAIRASR